jgi:alpha-D-ribose 1-methylphosphonate 5-triphosphate synthase subunit PhnG
MLLESYLPKKSNYGGRFMVITQTLGRSAVRVDTAKGRAAILKVKKENKDISAVVDADVRAKKPKTKKGRTEARQKAILRAKERNPAFRTALQAALTRLVGQ